MSWRDWTFDILQLYQRRIQWPAVKGLLSTHRWIWVTDWRRLSDGHAGAWQGTCWIRLSCEFQKNARHILPYRYIYTSINFVPQAKLWCNNTDIRYYIPPWLWISWNFNCGCSQLTGCSPYDRLHPDFTPELTHQQKTHTYTLGGRERDDL